MNYDRLQLIGPSALFVAGVAADAAAVALAGNPRSEFLWYINLEWFEVFQRSYSMLPDWLSFSKAAVAFIFPLFVVASAAYRLRARLSLAIASNLSFVYAGLLFYAWFKTGYEEPVASLSFVNISPTPDLYLVAMLLVASLFSLVISHLGYLRALRSSDC